jgi:multidrug efflux pump subunit AcrA (membrane-fusion protein)
MLEKLNPFHRSKKEKIIKFLKTPIGVIVLLLVLVFGASASMNYINSEDKQSEEKKEEKITQVKTNVIDNNADNSSFIETVGVIKAESKIDITATTRGTVKGIYFEVGDKVDMNTVLVSLYDNTTLTTLNNAQMNYANMQNNLGATERLTEESINQAENGVKAAAESVKSAEIALETAKTNLKNGKALREKSNLDTKNSAIVSYNGFLNTIFSSLDDVENLISTQSTYYPTNIEKVLGAKKPETLSKTKTYYNKVSKAYDELNQKSLNVDNITKEMADISSTLSDTQTMINFMLSALDNTVTDLNFTDAMLSTQKTNFIALRSAIVNAQSSAESILRTLENLDLVTQQEIDRLESAVLSAQNQLDLAKTNYNNALVSLENAKKGKEQQIISSQTSLDSARGQLNLAQAQTADLSIKAPINGQITSKSIDLGTEVNPGQVIAQIQQAKNVKIEIDLPSEDIYRIGKDNPVKIGNQYEGMISSIAPAADPITRKVKVEIVYNNENNDLIPGTYIEVKIPVKQLEKTNAESVYIPLRAITITQSEKYIFLAENGIAKKVNIKTGKTEGAMIEIIEGLKPGDQLITEGAKTLEDGETIDIIK